MFAVTAEIYREHACIRLHNDTVSVWLTRQVGPRIIGCRRHSRPDLLAQLPDFVHQTPQGNRYRFYGGHRLWVAPEHPEASYLPEDSPVDVERHARGVTVASLCGDFEKRLTVTLPNEAADVLVDHTLINRSQTSRRVAPWAITQLKPGGIALLPQQIDAGNGLLPNRAVVLWPYSDINSPHLTLGNRYIWVDATIQRGKLKIGWNNGRGWQAYFNEGERFVKYSATDSHGSYGDLGSSGECFCEPAFLELESLAPLTNLQPNEAVHHRERWLVDAAAPPAERSDAVADRLARLIEAN